MIRTGTILKVLKGVLDAVRYIEICYELVQLLHDPDESIDKLRKEKK